MSLSEKAIKHKQEYSIQYAKDKLKRIPLDVSLEKYEEIKNAAADSNESINGYIKKSIDQRMHADQDML